MSEPKDSPLRDPLDDQKETTKQSTQRREPLFDGATDGTDWVMGPYGPYIPTEDTRTDAERAELLAWADRCVARNSHYGPKHPLYKPPPPGATDATARANGDSTREMPASPAKTCECDVRLSNSDMRS